jgi:hypothetical protein
MLAYVFVTSMAVHAYACCVPQETEASAAPSDSGVLGLFYADKGVRLLEPGGNYKISIVLANATPGQVEVVVRRCGVAVESPGPKKERMGVFHGGSHAKFGGKHYERGMRLKFAPYECKIFASDVKIPDGWPQGSTAAEVTLLYGDGSKRSVVIPLEIQ